MQCVFYGEISEIHYRDFEDDNEVIKNTIKIRYKPKVPLVDERGNIKKGMAFFRGLAILKLVAYFSRKSEKVDIMLDKIQEQVELNEKYRKSHEF